MPTYAIDDASPTLGEGVWIAPDAHVIGDARLGERANVWFGAVIRADNTPIIVGARSNVQEGAMLHSDPGAPLTVGDDVTVGHHAILHGCTVGHGALIGMGAIILNGAVIGDGCIVGAGALVTEGKEFPDGSMIIGSPAKVVRELTPEQIEGLRQSAQHYIDNARRFQRGLRKIG